jgi:GNAT superfamily N-acetyltransferase
MGAATSSNTRELIVSESTLSVRRARREDWPLFKAFRLESLRDEPDAFTSTYDTARRLSDDRWRTLSEQLVYFLVERDDEVLGMVAGGFNNDHPGTHWLYAMYVTPSARGSAAATMLVDEVCAWARNDGAKELYLHVTTTLERARAFYQKVGFEPTGESFAMSREPELFLMTLRRSLG